MSAASKIFIDGEAGKTGLESAKSSPCRSADVISINPARRKDVEARAEMMREANLIVLCCPTMRARDAVALADSLGRQAAADSRCLEPPSARIIPGSTVSPRSKPRAGRHDCGCASRGQSRLLSHRCHCADPPPSRRRRVAAPRNYPITINAVSGYSGGGRQMIEQYEGRQRAPSFELYALGYLTNTCRELDEI